MYRKALPLLTGLAVIATIGFTWWYLVQRSLALPPEAVALPTRTESMRLMEQWQSYARRQEISSVGGLTQQETVDLMNEHTRFAFPGQAITFVLWNPEMPPPRGFALHSPAKPWSDGRWRRVGERSKRPFTTSLHDLTDSRLELNGFHTRVIDGKGFVFPGNLLIPPLVTRHLPVPADVRGGWLAAFGGGGRLPIMWAENVAGGGATLSPDGREVTLRAEADYLDRACAEVEDLISRGSEWREMKTKLRERREKAVGFVSGMLRDDL